MSEAEQHRYSFLFLTTSSTHSATPLSVSPVAPSCCSLHSLHLSHCSSHTLCQIVHCFMPDSPAFSCGLISRLRLSLPWIFSSRLSPVHLLISGNHHETVSHSGLSPSSINSGVPLAPTPQSPHRLVHWSYSGVEFLLSSEMPAASLFACSSSKPQCITRPLSSANRVS